MIPLEKLLEPISEQNPCGTVDPFDGRLSQLESLIKTELDAEETEVEPAWQKVREGCLNFMAGEKDFPEGVKDLRVGVILCLAQLKLEGLAGFRDGLALLHGWTERFWDSLFPLEPEVPEIRVNVFNNFSASLVTETPYKFVKYLREVALCQPARLNARCLREVQQAQGPQQERQPSEEGGEKPRVTLEQIAASFRDTPLEKLQQTHEIVGGVLQAVKALEARVGEKSSGSSSPNFTLLRQTLEAMRDTIAPYIAPQPELAIGTEAPSVAGPKAQGLGGGTFQLAGAIRSRVEAEAALRAARDYFSRDEPSSAAPLLIDRVLRLSGKTFLECLDELAIGSPDEFKKLFGGLPEKREEPSA
jgi:type VI secretion system protein ImpA